MIDAAVRRLTRFDRAADGLAADAALYGVSAVFALVTALTSTLLPHRAWGAVAGWAYLGALLVTAWWWARHRSTGRGTLTLLAWLGTALLPLIVQAVQRSDGRTDRAQEEVMVVEEAGARLLDAGTPYLGPHAIAALPPGEQLLGYFPYQPGMAVFGLPRAIAGTAWWTDARVWFAVATAAALGTAVAVLRSRAEGHDRNPTVRAVQFTTVLPVCALTLATGGDDLPVLALCLLALSCCAADRFGAAGVAVGAAAATKLFAFPIVVVLAVLALTCGRGRRFLAGAAGLPVLVLLPTFAVDADAFVENVIRFPLGEGLVTSPAQSPFPGHLIAAYLPGGRYVAAGLLAAAAVAITVRVVRRPPRTAVSAALISGYGLLTAILLVPSTRFGYLLYPLALLVWASALAVPAASIAPAGAPTQALR